MEPLSVIPGHGGLEEKRLLAEGTIVHMASIQDEAKYHRPFLAFWGSKECNQGSLAPFQVKIWRDLFASAILHVSVSTMTPGTLSTWQVTTEHLPAHDFPRTV